jgi:hypothetical protein
LLQAADVMVADARLVPMLEVARWLATASDVSVPKALRQTIAGGYTYRSGGMTLVTVVPGACGAQTHKRQDGEDGAKIHAIGKV